MSDKTLTDAAFEKLKTAAQGNGIDVAKMELLGSDEETLTIKAEMTLRLDFTREKANYAGGFRNARGLPKGRAKAITAAETEQKISELKTKATTGGYWSKDSARQIKAEPNQGWGLERADVILDALGEVFYQEKPCTGCYGKAWLNCDSCKGSGHYPCTLCRETGLEICYNCNGMGVNSSSPDQHCNMCNGTRQTYCRDCRGQRQMTCHQCRGQGKSKCNTCAGNGSFTQEEYVVPVVKAEFRIIDSAELPGGFRRAISRAGTKSLAKGHATITMHELTGQEAEKDNPNPIIPYTAILPFADMRVRINGKPLRCSIMGHKGVILDLPPFLDNALMPRITAFEDAIKKPDTLAKALEIRICREAFGLLQSKTTDAKNLRQLYPAGLSIEMAERILVLMRKLVHGQTMVARLVVAAVSVVVFSVLYYFIVSSGLRLAIAAAIKPIVVLCFDGALCVGGYFLQNYLLRLAAAKKLQKQLGKGGAARSQSAGGVGIVAGVLVMVIYVVMLFVLKSAPMWREIIMHPFG
jgi:hypothetical protein